MKPSYTQVRTPAFVQGVEIDPSSQKVIWAGPSLQWAIGMKRGMFRRYCEDRGWELIDLPEVPHDS